MAHSSNDDADAWWRSMPRRNAQKVAHLLAGDLRRQILSGELASGERLPPETELTALFGVSRDTLREALRILESQSLLEIRRGRTGGAVVRQAGLDAVGRYVALLLQLRGTTLADLEEARAVVEPPAAALLAEREGDDHIDRLVELHHAEREAQGDALAFVDAVAAFDQAVTEFCGSRSLGVIAGVFQDIYAGQVFAAIGHTDRTSAERIARRVVVSHSALLDAVRRRDASLAGATWNDYLYTTTRSLVNRSLSRQPMDITPLWRARAGHGDGEPSQGRALEVAAEIRARIAEGRLREGDRLAPLPELASEFGISRPTLREALRILETESLLDLRSGDRAGSSILTPTTQMAAQLAGMVLEARQTTMADFRRALSVLEPAIIEMAASRISARPLKQLREFEAELGRSVDDTRRFVATLSEAQRVAFSAARNPALTVIAEILHWVRIGIQPAVTAEASTLPFVAKTNRRAHTLFSEFVTAAGSHDGPGARDVWTRFLTLVATFVDDSALGQRLVLDVIG